MGYYSFVSSILSLLETTLQSSSSFDSDNVTHGYYKQITSFPYLLVSLRRDTPKNVVNLNDHNLLFDLLLFYRGTGDSEVDKNTLISYQSEIRDSLEDMSNPNEVWMDSSVNEADSSFNRDRSMVILVSHITVAISRRFAQA